MDDEDEEEDDNNNNNNNNDDDDGHGGGDVQQQTVTYDYPRIIEERSRRQKKGVSSSKNKTKKKALPTGISCSSAGVVFSVRVAVVTPCSSPPFAPWVVAAVHAVGRCCWLLCVAGHAWLVPRSRCVLELRGL